MFIKSDALIKIFLCEAIRINVPIKLLEIENDYAHKLYKSSFVIVRPDLMIAWRSNSMPSNPLIY